ncbi:Homoserine O-acetyltransferase [hydrothermal vent metagenome]|uniref:Homoserine O-acetyltransferase n=1 Tax=hydrothermal vent metagenome TaxID=652676 RepID=A0A3B1DYC4_9ZZZZ
MPTDHSPSSSDKNSVGIVETHQVILFKSPDLLHTECGAQLESVTVAYETYGTLSPKKDNAIFVCHALTGDAHAAGWHSEESKKPGWWEGFVGPGLGIDTNKYFVICANTLGGCSGTTGPGSINPSTNVRYGLDFPVITVGDIVSVYSELVSHLEISKLLAVVGGSLGGMQTLEWAARYPDQLSCAVVIASAANLSAQGIAFNTVGRRAILADPGFHEGNYDNQEGPKYGLALARMLAHITYLSEDSIEMKFGRRLQDREELAFDLSRETEFQVESYLHYQGKRFVERFDANSYLYLTKAMDYFHLGDRYESLENAFSKTDARFLLLSYTTDWLFPTSQSEEIVKALLTSGKQVSFAELESPYGHDAFLIELEQLAKLVTPFLAHTYESCQ